MISKADLKRGHITGVVDSYGAVHSEFRFYLLHHADLWPTARVRWRWCNSQSLFWLDEARPDGEQLDAIKRHITKKYGLPWWENGHHDIDWLLNRKPQLPAWKIKELAEAKKKLTKRRRRSTV